MGIMTKPVKYNEQKSLQASLPKNAKISQREQQKCKHNKIQLRFIYIMISVFTSA
jgi:hypothetical protein